MKAADIEHALKGTKPMEDKKTDQTAQNGHLDGVSKHFIAITYMVYIITWEILIIGGFGYVVFALNKSGWWMFLAVLLSASAYRPQSWRKLF